MRIESYNVLNTSCEMLGALSAWWKIVIGIWFYNHKFEFWNVILQRICVKDKKHKEIFLVIKSSWEREKKIHSSFAEPLERKKGGGGDR